MKILLAFQLPSSKFHICLSVLPSSLRQSHSKRMNINDWENFATYIQCGIYTNTMRILSAIRTDRTNRLQSKFPSLGFNIPFPPDHSLKKCNSPCCKTRSMLRANIFNIRHLINSLAIRKANLCAMFLHL